MYAVASAGRGERERERVWKRLYIPGSTNVPPRYALFQQQLPAARIIPPRSILISAVCVSLSLSLSLSFPFVVFLPMHPPPRFKSKAGTKTIGLAMYIQTTLFLLVTFSRYVPSCTPFPVRQVAALPVPQRPLSSSRLFILAHAHMLPHSHTLTHTLLVPLHSFLRPMNMFFAGKCLNLAILAKILHKVNGQMGKQSD